ESRRVRGTRRRCRLARQADVLRDHHQGQGDRTRSAEVLRHQDEGADDGSRRQSCVTCRSCRRRRSGDRKGHTRELTATRPARSGRERPSPEECKPIVPRKASAAVPHRSPPRSLDARHPEDEMNKLDIAAKETATLETAPTRYIEGHGIRFAYRRLGPATG